MLAGLTVCMMIALIGFPETALARWLDRTVVAALRKITRTHLIFLILMSVVLIAGTELLAMAGPFDMALVVLWDVSTYVDIALTTVVVASAARGGAGWRGLIGYVRRAERPRARRNRTRKPAAPPANDDEHPALAAAA